MVTEWIKVKLGDIFKVKHGFAFKGEYFVDYHTKTILVTPGNFNIGGGFENQKKKFYDGPVPDDYVLKVDQIVLTMTDLSKESDTLGYSAIVPNDGNTWLHNQRVGLLNFKNEIPTDPVFINYLLRTHGYRSWVIGSASGTTVKHTSPGRIEVYECEIPPISEQKAIAHILRSLDDKIELNRRMNKTLEGMAQALFKSWFVDFDPVIDNALEAGNSIPEELTKRAEIRRKALADGTANREVAKQFPSSFQLTKEMGFIPEGWEICPLKEVLVELESGNRPKGGACDEGIPSIGAENVISIGRYNYSKEKYVPENYFNTMQKGIVQDRDVVIYKDGANIGRSSYFGDGFPHEKCCVNEHVFILRSSKSIGSNLLFFWVERDETRQRIANLNTNSAQPGINQTSLKSLKFLKPSHSVAKIFNEKVEPFIKKIFLSANANQSLIKIRDTLLPKLISGELRVPDAEKLVKDAL